MIKMCLVVLFVVIYIIFVALIVYEMAIIEIRVYAYFAKTIKDKKIVMKDHKIA